MKTVPEAELQVETPRFLVRLRIRGTKCRLLGPDLPELKSLLGAPGMGAGLMIMELERAGKTRSRIGSLGGGGGGRPWALAWELRGGSGPPVFYGDGGTGGWGDRGGFLAM